MFEMGFRWHTLLLIILEWIQDEKQSDQPSLVNGAVQHKL